MCHTPSQEARMQYCSASNKLMVMFDDDGDDGGAGSMMIVVIIVIMGEIRLSDRYSLGKGDDLYSLKWYKDEVEFYRFVIII